jgi:thioester reductase-like protein
MSKQAPADRIDARLETLLDTERRLAALVRAEEEAQARRLDAARARVTHAKETAEATLTQAVADQDRALREAHTQALATLQQEHAATLARLAALTDQQLDALARRALAAAGGGP